MRASFRVSHHHRTSFPSPSPKEAPQLAKDDDPYIDDKSECRVKSKKESLPEVDSRMSELQAASRQSKNRKCFWCDSRARDNKSNQCDETKPHCQRCANYGVTCDYYELGTELHVFTEAIGEVFPSLWSPCSTNNTMLELINGTLRETYALYREHDSLYQLGLADLALLHRFQTRTVIAISTPTTRTAYQEGIIRLLACHPYLLHLVMTMTAAHDRFLGSPSYSKPTLMESFHSCRAVAMFKQKLNMPIASEDKDSIFATCALIKGVHLGSVDAAVPEESWPLSSGGPPLLDWIGLQEGLHTIWKLIYPLPAGSAFHDLALQFSGRLKQARPDVSGIEGIPTSMAELYELDESSNCFSSPYYRVVHTISSLLMLQCSNETLLDFFRFSGELSAEFRQLLCMKDPRAMLLVAYWYAMVCRGPWFIQRRAAVECQAICIYLERHYAYETRVQDLLSYPKSKVGL